MIPVLAAACVADHRAPHTTDPMNNNNGDCEPVDHDVSVRTAADVADLPTGCWDLYGKLTVNGSAITSLAMLGDIRSANDIEIVGTGLTSFDTKSPVDVWYGEIHVASNNALHDLKNLTIHDGHVAHVLIDSNPQLVSFELDGLQKIDTDLQITNNSALQTVAFQTLTEVDGAIAVDNNAALRTVGFHALGSVTELELVNNAQLTSVTGLPSSQILGDFIIRNNPVLTSLVGLSSLSRIRGTLTIDGNKALTSLGAIPASSAILEGALMITNNAALTDLGGLSHFNYIASITITGNAQLAYCPAHELLQCVTNYGQQTISNNKSGTTTNCSYWCN
jgi:hypothetical protein